jgi:hypothetical protein
MKLAFLIGLLLVASPVAAQTSQIQQPLGTGGMTNNSPLTNTGVICQEEMVATFCNMASSPNHAGYGTNGGAAATSAGITTPSPAIPACGDGNRHRQRAVQLRRSCRPARYIVISRVPTRA